MKYYAIRFNKILKKMSIEKDFENYLPLSFFNEVTNRGLTGENFRNRYDMVVLDFSRNNNISQRVINRLQEERYYRLVEAVMNIIALNKKFNDDTIENVVYSSTGPGDFPPGGAGVRYDNEKIINEINTRINDGETPEEAVLHVFIIVVSSMEKINESSKSPKKIPIEEINAIRKSIETLIKNGKNVENNVSNKKKEDPIEDKSISKKIDKKNKEEIYESKSKEPRNFQDRFNKKESSLFSDNVRKELIETAKDCKNVAELWTNVVVPHISGGDSVEAKAITSNLENLNKSSPSLNVTNLLNAMNVNNLRVIQEILEIPEIRGRFNELSPDPSKKIGDNLYNTASRIISSKNNGIGI